MFRINAVRFLFLNKVLIISVIIKTKVFVKKVRKEKQESKKQRKVHVKQIRRYYFLYFCLEKVKWKKLG